MADAPTGFLACLSNAGCSVQEPSELLARPTHRQQTHRGRQLAWSAAEDEPTARMDQTTALWTCECDQADGACGVARREAVARCKTPAHHEKPPHAARSSPYVACREAGVCRKAVVRRKTSRVVSLPHVKRAECVSTSGAWLHRARVRRACVASSAGASSTIVCALNDERFSERTRRVCARDRQGRWSSPGRARPRGTAGG